MKKLIQKRKICIVTGTRADYGILKPVMQKIVESDFFDLQIIATGTHLEEKFGYTLDEIEQDGFEVHEKIDLDLSSDDHRRIVCSMGGGLKKFSDSLCRLNPDLVFILGDRFEILVAAQTALMLRFPLAHLSGGDVTHGAIDDSIRHAITKMAHIHFVTNEGAKNRVIQLGENPKMVFNFGNPSLDHIHNFKFLSKSNLEKEINFQFLKKNIVVTFHPETALKDQAFEQIKELLDALSVYTQYGIIFTMPNADPENYVIAEKIKEFCLSHHNAKWYYSLGYKNYMNVLNHVDAVVGNSSSGILEAPSFNLPCVNIGDRQTGRMQSNSTINTFINRPEIQSAIEQALSEKPSIVHNPYGDGHSSSKIVKKLEEIGDYKKLLKKEFYDIKQVEDNA